MQELNYKLYNKEDEQLRLHKNVRERLIEIANAFLDDLREQNINIYPADIRLVGSNAGFDFTPHSDIDLHLVVDFDLYSQDPAILQSALNICRQRFNDQYNITVKGINVEIYAEDIHSANISNGIYSIIQNRWIKFPEEESEMAEYITPEIKEKANRWVELIQAAIDKTAASESEAEVFTLECEHLINRLYLMRKTGLETGGRLSAGNLIFKQVRNSGMLDAVKAKRNEYRAQALTLESLRRAR